jgi:hypothetical protein
MPYDNRHTLVPDLAASGAGDEVIMSAPFTFPEHAGEFVPLPPQENRAVQWSVFPSARSTTGFWRPKNSRRPAGILSTRQRIHDGGVAEGGGGTLRAYGWEIG